MSFGAMLTDSAGLPFYIDGTMPISLVDKITVNFTAGSGTVQSYVLFAEDANNPRFIFIQSNNSNTQSAEWVTLESDGIWRLYTTNSTKTVTVFVFGYAYQPLPDWGIAIRDASGNVVLTNETKVLRGVNRLGDIGNDAASGYNLSQTLSGSWAIAPTFTGIVLANFTTTGQPVIFILWFYASAYYNGSTTLINSHLNGSISGATSTSHSNARNNIMAIDVSNY